MLSQPEPDNERSPRLGGSRKILTPDEQRAKMVDTLRRMARDHEDIMRRFAVDHPEAYAEMQRQDAERDRDHRWATPFHTPPPVEHGWQVLKAHIAEVSQRTRIDLVDVRDSVDRLYIARYTPPSDLAQGSGISVSAPTDRALDLTYIAVSEFGSHFIPLTSPPGLMPLIRVRAFYDRQEDRAYVVGYSWSALLRIIEDNYARRTFRACPDCQALLATRGEVDHLREWTEFSYHCRQCDHRWAIRLRHEMFGEEHDYWLRERNRRRELERLERNPDYYRGL